MNMLTKTGVIAASAAAAVAILPILAKAAPTPAPQPTYQFERCFGVNASGKNDCGARGVHACAGESKTANDPQSWIYVPVGTCAKIQGGSTMPKA
jgi:uncharacterized membrane protein